MKITERVVLGVLATAVLASAILFALDAYYAKQAASRLKALSKANAQDAKPAGGLDNEDVKPSIGTKEQQIVYQMQENAGQGGGSQHSGQDGQAAKGPGSQNENPIAGGGSNAEAEIKPAAGSNAEAEIKPDDADASQTEDLDKAARQDAQDLNSSPKKKSFQKVTEDYFADALFIGDSRTVGMQQSNLLPNATYYAKTGIGIGDILSQRIVCEGGAMISVEDALSRHSFGKVYIMVGINDMSSGDVDWFLGQYAKILEAVCQTQPDAIVYIQGNIPMSYGIQDMGGPLNNQNLTLRNEASRTLADSESIFYLDVDEVYEDGNGHLAQMYTRDGLHVSTRYYPLWVDYLEHHAIVR